MQITEVIVKPIPPEQSRPGSRPLVAVCSVTFDNVFVIHEVKVIGPQPYLVVMPSRRVSRPCWNCKRKNPTNDHYCGDCGERIPTGPLPPLTDGGRPKFESDIAHPIDPLFRNYLRDVVRQKVSEHFVMLETTFQPTLSGSVSVP